MAEREWQLGVLMPLLREPVAEPTHDEAGPTGLWSRVARWFGGRR
jgi:hypothetical protein